MAAQTYSQAILLDLSVDMQGLAFSIAAESVVYGESFHCIVCAV